MGKQERSTRIFILEKLAGLNDKNASLQIVYVTGESEGFYTRERGLCLDRDLSAREVRRQYFGAAAQRMKGYDFYHVAIAHVPGGRAEIQVAQERAP